MSGSRRLERLLKDLRDEVRQLRRGAPGGKAEGQGLDLSALTDPELERAEALLRRLTREEPWRSRRQALGTVLEETEVLTPAEKRELVALLQKAARATGGGAGVGPMT